MKRSLTLLAAALVLALAATQSRADTFWYNWTRSIPGGAPGQTFFTTVPTTPLGPNDPAHNTTINLNDQNGNNFVKAGTPTGIPAVQVQVFSDNQNDNNPDMIVAGTGHYHLQLDIFNNAVVNGQNTKGPLHGTVSFNGDLEGNANADLANLTNSITNATDPTNGTSNRNWAQVQVGDTMYTITYSGYAEAGGTSTLNSGTISFHVTAAPATNGGKTPEPSSMVLGCLGLSFLGGVVWRARRRKMLALQAMA